VADNRRTPSGGSRPRGKAGPGRGSAGRAPVRPPQDTSPRPERPRFTGRAAILILVLAVLAVSYASSFRAYLQQRDHIADLRSRIEATGNNIDQLEREKRRWEDDAYVGQQARLRFGYVKAGENVYQVLDENGLPLDSPDTLSDPGNAPEDVPTAWWDTAWASVEAAGNLPDEDAEEKPPTSIKAPSE
jgi:cell division protein FtsB